MAEDVLLFEVKDRIAYLTLNRSDALNALNRELSGRIGEAMEEINVNPDIYLGIVRGAGGRAFSSGMDLRERAATDASEGTAREPRRAPGPGWECEKPLIAAIDGFCIAGGLEVAIRCDIRIATPKSEFGLPEPRWSLLAGTGLHNLSRMVPLGEALYMQLTGSRISAQRAYEIGLIQRVVPAETLMEEAKKIADEILMCAPLAVQAIKKVVMTGKNLPVDYSFKFAEAYQASVAATEDRIEGPKAFSEKRRPVWKGR